MSWSGTDIAIVFVVGLSLLTGLIRGFVRELVSLLAWVIAVLLCVKQSQLVTAFLAPYVEDTTLQLVLSFILIIIGVLFLGMLVNALIGFMLKHAGLSLIDRLVGMGFGFARGAFIVALVMVMVGMTGLDLKPYEASSRFYHYFTPLTTWIAQYVEPLLQEAMQKTKKMQQQKDKKKPSSDTPSAVSLPESLSIDE